MYLALMEDISQKYEEEKSKYSVVITVEHSSSSMKWPAL
jgi:hypothetical protein